MYITFDNDINTDILAEIRKKSKRQRDINFFKKIIQLSFHKNSTDHINM